MPAPRPSITPSVGAKEGKAANRVAKARRSSPPARAIPAESSVRSIAAAERKTSVRTIIADGDADELTDGRLLLLGLVDDLAAARRLDARALRDRRGPGEALAGLGAEVHRRCVVLDRREADPPVRGELGLRHAA